MTQLYTGLSGRGKQALETPLTGDVAWRAVVTNLGTAQEIDVNPPVRLAHVGWIAFYEASPDSAELGVGDSLFPPQWIGYERSTYASVGVTIVQGVDGFYYAFGPGIQVTIELDTPG